MPTVKTMKTTGAKPVGQCAQAADDTAGGTAGRYQGPEPHRQDRTEGASPVARPEGGRAPVPAGI